jgi:large subunit ribosomal protein L19
MFKLDTQNTIKNLESNFIKKDLPTLKIGDSVKIGVKIIEGNKERVQFYEGTIIAKKNSSINTTITVRKVLQGIGVERIFLIHSPKISKSTSCKIILFKKFTRKSYTFKTNVYVKIKIFKILIKKNFFVMNLRSII